MKKITISFLLLVALSLMNGCGSSSCGRVEDEAICQERLSLLDEQIEGERQKGYLTPDEWQTELTTYKDLFGYNEESWRSTFLSRLKAIQQRQALIAHLQDTFPETWKQKLWEYDQAEAKRTNALVEKLFSDFNERERIYKQKEDDRRFMKELQQRDHDFWREQNRQMMNDLNSGVIRLER